MKVNTPHTTPHVPDRDAMVRIATEVEGDARPRGWDQPPALMYVRRAGSGYRISKGPARLLANFPAGLIGEHAPQGTCAIALVSEGWRFPDHDADGTTVGASWPSQHPDRVETRSVTVVSSGGTTCLAVRDRGGPLITMDNASPTTTITGRLPSIARRFMRLPTTPMGVGELSARVLLHQVQQSVAAGTWPEEGGERALCLADDLSKPLFARRFFEDAERGNPGIVEQLLRCAGGDGGERRAVDIVVAEMAERWLLEQLSVAADADWITAELFDRVDNDWYASVKQDIAEGAPDVDWWGVDEVLREQFSERSAAVCDQLASVDPSAARRLRRVVAARLNYDGLPQSTID